MSNLKMRKIKRRFTPKLPVRERRSIRARFTMIELLVVIGIIIILLAILLPALRVAKQRVNGMKCSNKLKQFGIAMYNYANDYEDWLVPSFDASTSNSDIEFLAAA